MSDIERMTVTLPADMAETVRSAVGDGDYASSSEVVREALRDWKVKRASQRREMTALKSDIRKGLNDLAKGRVKPFNAGRIVKRGKTLLGSHSRSG